MTLTRDQLARLAGTYRIDESSVRRVVVEGTRIYKERDQGKRVETLAASPRTLFCRSSLSCVTFDEDNNGNVIRMVMHRETGEEETARKER